MKILLIPLMILLALHLAAATVTLEVTAFNCSPDEVAVTEDFSCTATVENSGDETGSLTTATLYTDSGNWLEESSYTEVVNSNINSGASTDLVFEGLRAQKSGEFGFSRITLDDVSDTYPADNSVEVNVINAITILSQSANSAAASTGTVDSSAQITVGGNVDIVVSFSVVSGGCSIGTQASSASFPDLSDGQSVSQTWTITMGTSNCVYSISSQATSNPTGTATKTDISSKTITCSGSSCTVESSNSGSNSSSSSSSSGSTAGGGGGGGSDSTNTSDDNKTPHEPPEFFKQKETINLDDYSSWKKSGKITLSNLKENQTIFFIYITPTLKKQNWILIIEDINAEKNQVVIFIKQEEQSSTDAKEVRVYQGTETELDLNEDGTTDIFISITEIQDGLVTLSMEKASTFLEQETQLKVKRIKVILIILICTIIFFILLGGIFYVISKRRENSNKRKIANESSKRYYNQK